MARQAVSLFQLDRYFLVRNRSRLVKRVLACATCTASGLWMTSVLAQEGPSLLPPPLASLPTVELTPAAQLTAPRPLEKSVDRPAPSSEPRRVDLEKLRNDILQLKSQREALESARSAPSRPAVPARALPDDSHRLRIRLNQLLSLVAVRSGSGTEREAGLIDAPPPSLAPAASSSLPGASGVEATHVEDMEHPLNPLGLAHTLFLGGDYPGALKAFGLVDTRGLRVEDQTPIVYMKACCLRKMGNLEEAANLYREVAATKGDEIMADCARWQIESLRWRRELEDQLQDIRRRLQAVEVKP